MKINKKVLPVQIMNNDLPKDMGIGNNLLDEELDNINGGFANAILLASILIIGVAVVIFIVMFR